MLPFWAVLIHSSIAYVRYGLQVQISKPKTSGPLTVRLRRAKYSAIIRAGTKKKTLYMNHAHICTHNFNSLLGLEVKAEYSTSKMKKYRTYVDGETAYGR